MKILCSLFFSTLAAAAIVAAPAHAGPQDPHAGHSAHAGHGDHSGHSGHAAGTADAHAAHRAALADGATAAPAAAGALSIPDVPVLTQDGREVHFYRDLVAGKTVAMNFVFTTCTTICPPMGAYFGKLQDELGDRLGNDVHLISVSIDPDTDTPERMAEWGARFGARDGWTLVTGEVADIERLLKALEVFTPDAEDHAPVALIGNAETGSWTRASGLARPDELAKLIDRAATGGAR